MSAPALTRTWPSLAALPRLYPDARNRVNRGPLRYRAGRCFPLTAPLSPRDRHGRAPVLAVGSNAYPRQLADKLQGTPADRQGIPLLPTILRGFDTAYCPVRSRKGYVPVTLTARPGAISLTWLQWLTREQLDLIAATEGPRYALVGSAELAQAAQLPPAEQPPPTLYAWWFDSLLLEDGAPVWLDVHGGAPRQQARLEPDGAARPNPIPTGWRIVPRGPAPPRVQREYMSELC